MLPIHRILLLGCAITSFASSAAFAQTRQLPDSASPPLATAASQTNSPLEQILAPIASAHQGDVALAVRHLTTGESFQINGSRPQATASLIKLPIMVEVYQQAIDGKVALYRQLELRQEDTVPGSGILTSHFSPGTRFLMRDVVRLMMAFSDNTATNMLVDKVGIAELNAHMERLGYPQTRLNSKVYRRDTSVDLTRSQRYGLASTTATDMVDLLSRIHAGKIVSPMACKEMLEHLAACDDKLKFPALLPAGTKIYHKTGSVDKVRTDAGIIETSSGPFALCVLTENNRDTSWTDRNEGDRLCAQIAKATFDYFEGKRQPASPGEPQAESTAPLTLGASGDLVEALQRTLNAQADVTSKLSVDGDFGPATEKALMQFQKSKGLEASGRVDTATWQALGPLRWEDEPVETPELVNAHQPAKQPADDPFGIPAVTCKAWVIADAADGQVLWGHNHNHSLDIASTTKIMTAYLVIQYCQAHPQALDEVIVFSKRADNTIGSTSAIRAGESVRVGDLLYGLLLPSGNDASVALAEHFGARVRIHRLMATAKRLAQPSATAASDLDRSGDRLPPPVVNPEWGTELSADGQPEAILSASTADENYQAFVEAMNHTALDLGMLDSHFVNPHGLTAKEHKSTCDDLVKLTVAARKLPLFQRVTSTMQYGCQVTGRDGYLRNVKWLNTNQLLPIEGYLGVKTGTTDAAGACLVSIGRYQQRELVVVVLGSAVSSARYTDARNLYAWAWRQLSAGASSQ